MKRVAYILGLVLTAAVLVAACQRNALVVPAPAGTSVANTPAPLPTNTPTPTATPSPTPSPTPTRTPTPASTSSDLEGETSALSGQPFEMALTEQEVNELAQEALATQANVPVSDATVRLEDGQVVASGRVRVGFFAVDVELTGTVPVKDGRPAPEITDIKVNGQTLSGPLRSQLMSMITPYLDQLAQADLAVKFDDVQITSGQIRIVGQYR